MGDTTQKAASVAEDVQIWRRPQVLAITGLSTPEIYRMMALEPPVFPRPIKLTERGRAVGWLAHEVRGWIADRVAASRAAKARPAAA